MTTGSSAQIVVRIGAILVLTVGVAMAVVAGAASAASPTVATNQDSAPQPVDSTRLASSECSYFQTDRRIAHEGSTAGVLEPTGPTEPDPVIVLLGGFTDTEPTYNASDFEAAFFGTGTANVTGPGTLRDYYDEATNGLINLSSGPAGVRGWYETDMHSSEVTEEYSKFEDVIGGDLTPNDNFQFVRKVVNQADDDIDFSQYGSCLGVIIVYQNITFRAHATAPWGNFFADGDFAVNVDGATIAAYARVQEVHSLGGNRTGNQNAIGTPAHELGHLYGLPDLYEENGSDDISRWGLMATGNAGDFGGGLDGSSPTHFSAWTKLRLHTDPEPDDGDDVFDERTFIARAGQPGILPPAAEYTAFYRIDPREVEDCAACDGQYYLLAYRKLVGFDRGLVEIAGNNDALRISRINGPWDGDKMNDPDLIEGTNRLDGFGNASFNASNDDLAQLADGSDSGVDLRNFTAEYGVATFNDPPERHLDANETAVFAVAVATTLPDGTEVGQDWRVDNRVALNTSAVMSLRLIGAQTTTRKIQATASGQRFVEVKISQQGLGDGVVEEGAKLIHETNRSTDYVSATTYPVFPLPSNATVTVTDPWTDYAGSGGSVSFELNVSAAGEPYSYGMFGAPDPSHFTVTIGGNTVHSSNLTVTEQAEHSYVLTAPVRADRIDGYDLTVTFTDEKAGVSHTVSASGNVLTPILERMDGTGSGFDPYQITNVTELQAMDADRDAHYELADYIDAAETARWFDGRGFHPIGNVTDRRYAFPLEPQNNAMFNGSLQGEFFTISNLTINRPNASAAGLFVAVGPPGLIDGFTLSNATIHGGDRTGAVVGSNRGELRRIDTQTTIVTGDDATGGLVGVNHGQLDNVIVRGLVIGHRTDTGGLVGRVSGDPETDSIFESYSLARVRGGSSTGGLVGYNSRGRIAESFAFGDVTGSEIVGGLVGYNADGVVNQSYARGDVHAERRAGGLVGENQAFASSQQGGRISEAYASGRVTATSGELTGGLVATSSLGRIERSYWDAEGTGQPVALGTESDDGLYLAGKRTTAEMQGSDADTNLTDFDFVETWWTPSDDYPQLLEFINIDRPPEARFTTNASADTAARTPIRFNGSASTDSDDEIVAYAWRFGNDTRTTGAGPVVTHAYHCGGTYNVTLAVTDAAGTIDTVTHSVTVAQAATDPCEDETDDSGDSHQPLDLDDFSTTAKPGVAQPTTLADRLRMAGSVADFSTVERLQSTATNYSIAISSFNGFTNVTVYLQRNALNATLASKSLILRIDGTEQQFTKIQGPNGGSWIGFNVPSFSSRTVTLEPAAETTCVPGAVAGSNHEIELRELQRAINHWSEGATVPNTGGQTISLRKIQGLIHDWEHDTPVSCDGGS